MNNACYTNNCMAIEILKLEQNANLYKEVVKSQRSAAEKGFLNLLLFWKN